MNVSAAIVREAVNNSKIKVILVGAYYNVKARRNQNFTGCEAKKVTANGNITTTAGQLVKPDFANNEVICSI